MRRILSTVAVCLWAGAALADPPGLAGARAGAGMVQEPGTQSGLEAWLAGFRSRALAQGITAPTLDRALQGVSFDPDVIRRDRTQNEFTKTIWDYLDTAVSDERVSNGAQALARHAGLLARIEARWGVPAEVVVAVWGLESAYGTFRGKMPVVGSLATLAYDGRRAAFFEGQLIAALRIVQSGVVGPADMTGSWAGAMGHTQFMPLSYLDLAVDFSGDGRRDIWGDDPADALASTAAYLAANGWNRGQVWGLEVRLPEGFDYAGTGERVKRPVAAWAAAGVTTVEGAALPGTGLASVLLPAGAKGAAFLIFPNFQVIETYNTADAYVIAVGHLADRIAGGPPIRAGWPREDRALTLEERIELQERLSLAGFDAGGVDGRVGPLTIAAVRAFQRAQGLVPDGYANLDILSRLR